MTTKKVVITGAHSYLGQKLLRHLNDLGGFDIAAFVTPWADEKELFAGVGITYTKNDLREKLSEAAAIAVSDADRILHFAWVRGKQEKAVLDENHKMFANLIEHISNPERLVFISSVAASPETLSTYGKTKFAAANELLKYGAVVLVTGLIVDKEPKGPYKLLVSVVQKLPISVRFTKNSVKVYPIRTEDFINAITTVVSHPVNGGIYRVYPSDAADMNAFLVKLESNFPRTRLPLRVNYRLAIGTLKFLHRLHLMPPSLGEKLLTFLYKDEAYLSIHKSLLGNEAIDRPLDEMI